MLPEFVAGYGFQRVKREANAAGSFSFALLNALHAKNILDPIQRIQMERNYGTHRVPLPVGGQNRHCDIFLDYGGSKIGTAALANYGWRYRNYVEIKFLKSYARTKSGQDTRSSQNSAEIVADLVRLVTLVPEPELMMRLPAPKTASARYFLCLSDNNPCIFINKYLTSLRNTFASPPKIAEFEIDLTTGKAAKAFAERVGTGFSALSLKIQHATCFAHFPLDPISPNSVWMLLIRIDQAFVTWSSGGLNRTFGIDLNRTLIQGAPGDYAAIRDFVAVNLK